MRINSDIVKLIKENFCLKNFTIIERTKSLDISGVCKYSELPDKEKIKVMMGSIPERDKIQIQLNSIIQESISIASEDAIEIKYVLFCNNEDAIEDDEVEVLVRIEKIVEQGRMSIYALEEFQRWIFAKQRIEIIQIFDELLRGSKSLIFIVYDRPITFRTETISFINNENEIIATRLDREERLKKCAVYTKRSTGFQYSLIPEDFHIIQDENLVELKEFFQYCEMILAMVFLSDISHFERNNLTLKIQGQELAEFKIEMNSILEYNQELYLIYKWVMDSGEPIDKISIARNIISLHCAEGELNRINSTTMASIVSNFALFQKKNVDKYIELKNKMAEFIIRLVNDMNTAAENMFAKLRNNILAGISFIVTVVLVNIVSTTPLNSIFTNDVKLIFYFVILGSIVFLIISIMEVNAKIKSLSNAYQSLKGNYNDILDESDINNIFKNDKIFNEAIRYVEKRRNIIGVIWGLFIVAMAIIIELG